MTDTVSGPSAAPESRADRRLKQKWRDLFETEPPPYNRASSNIGSPTGSRNWHTAVSSPKH